MMNKSFVTLSKESNKKDTMKKVLIKWIAIANREADFIFCSTSKPLYA